jgi:uncharacterized protein YndB with AHSA1/START domain
METKGGIKEMNTQQLSEQLAPAAHYRKTLLIKASQEKVFQALSTNHGIAGWWTGNVQGEHEKGGIVRLEFDGPGHLIEMRIDELRDSELVAWSCVAHNAFPEWPSTKVIFSLTAELEASCKLSFEHLGLKQKCECYGDCSRGWDHFLLSLTSFCETGAGFPWKR